jgi:GH18 family chitinase
VYILGGFKKVNRLKLNNTELKTLLFLKTDSGVTGTFSAIIADIKKREKFARNLIAFTKLHKFNGVVIDWEYPSNFGKVKYEKVSI